MAEERVAVVPMRARHLKGVVAIESRTSPRPWSKELFASELKQASSRCFVATLPSSAVVGFGCLMSTGHEAHVTNLATDPSARRRGVASLLMLRLIDEAVRWGLDSMTLEVRVSNEPAIALYQRFGLEAEAVRLRYYPDTNEDASIMWVRGIDTEDYRRRLDAIVAELSAR